MPEPHDPGLYDLFVSYSTKDNLPPPGEKVGWVYAFIQRLRGLARQFTELDIQTTGDADAFPDWDTFYAPDEIQAGQLWEPRLRTAVAHSRVLLACLSPHYWESRWCRIEWETYLENESARGLANQVGGITPIYFVHAPDVSAADIIAQAPAWAADQLSARQVRLLDFSEHGADLFVRLTALRENADVESRVKAIATRVAHQIRHARQAERQQVGNVAFGTDTFVGRQAELALVENQLFGAGALGVITALRGIGGQGKTALALRYAQNLRSRYSGGRWQVGAERATELLPLLATLREPLGLAPIATDDDLATARRVLGDLYRRAHDPNLHRDSGDPAAVLLLLDNVDHAELLTPAQQNSLKMAMRDAGTGSDPGWLHILATTRLDAYALSFLPPQQIIPVDALSEGQALELWIKISGPLPEDQIAAARQIIVLVERHTLTVEIAVRHIRRTPGETSLTYLVRLKHALASGSTRLAHLLSGQQHAMQDRDLSGYAHPLAATLGFTFAHLAEEDPAAATVLHYAAHFPAESVPLPWLRTLAGRQHPELLAPPEFPGLPTAWDRAVLRLGESLRLLIPAADQTMKEVVRLHRLASIYLRATAVENGEDAARGTAVEGFIEERFKRAEQDHRAQLEAWERSVLLADLPIRMERSNCTNLMAMAGLLLGKILTAYADLATARRLYVAAHAVMQRLAESAPESPFAPQKSVLSRSERRQSDERWRELSVSLNQLGELATAQGNLPEAQRLFGECHRISQRLADSDPANAQRQRDLMVSLNQLGELATAQGNLPEAQRRFGECHRIAQRLAESDPSNAAWQRNLAVSLDRLGELATSQGNLPEAQRLFGECHGSMQRLAESDPSNAAWQRDLSMSLDRLGNLATAQGNLPEAQRLFGECHGSMQRLAESDPANAAWQRDLSQSLNRLGDLATAQGNLPEAQRLFGEAHRIAQRLAESDPANAEWHRDLSLSLNRLGNLATAQGNLPEIQRLFGESLRIAQRLAESDPTNADWQRDMFVSFVKLGELAIAQGNLPEAQRLFGEALHIAQRLAESDPANAVWQRDLSVSLDRLGDLARTQGNLPEAQRLFGEALRIRQRLAESDPENAAWQRDLAVSHYKLALFAGQSGDDVGAEAELRQCFLVLHQMQHRGLHFDPQMESVYHQLLDRIHHPPTPVVMEPLPRPRNVSPPSVSESNLHWEVQVPQLLRRGEFQAAIDLLRPVVFRGHDVFLNPQSPLDARVGFLQALMLAQNVSGVETHLSSLPEQTDPRVVAIRESVTEWRRRLTFLQRIGLKSAPPLPPPPGW